MAFTGLYRTSLALLLVLTASPVHPTQNHAPESIQHAPEPIQHVPEPVEHAPKPVEHVFESVERVLEDTQLSEEEREQIAGEEVVKAVKEMFAQYQTIPLPALPTFNIPGDKISISISLADIYLLGLNEVEGVDINLGMPSFRNHTASGTLVFKKISLLVGSYSSSGHINNMPLNGEGPMYVRLHNFSIKFAFKWHLKNFWSFIPCVEYDTTSLDLDLERAEAHFENLNVNEGADLGQLVDIVLPSFGGDIVKQLDVLISDTYYQEFDTIFVGLINKVTTCTEETKEDILKTSELIKIINDMIQGLIS